MRIRDIITRLCAVALATLIACTPVQAEEVVTGSDTTESINRILRKIEEMAGVLALNRQLSEEQTALFIDDLSELHKEVKGLQNANELLLELARKAVRDNVDSTQQTPAQTPVQTDPPVANEVPQQTPAQQQPAQQEPAPQPEVQEQPTEAQPQQTDPEAGTTPPERSEEWVPYLDFTRTVEPEGAGYNGWVEQSSIDILWGDPGQMIITVTNGYTATWKINNAYTGSPSVTVTTRQQGEMIVQVRDDNGLHEYSIRNGGIGPIFMRWVDEQEVAGNPA